MDMLENQENVIDISKAKEKIQDKEELVEVVEESESGEGEKKPFQLDENEPLNEISLKELSSLMHSVKDAVSMAQSTWDASKKEFGLTDTHMKSLYDYNLKNRVEKSEDVPEGSPEYDRFNGLDKITEEEVIEIFGEDSPIIGIEHQITIDRIKTVINDFFSWMTILREYQNVHEAYIRLIDYEEEKEINKLKEIVEKETDDIKKEKMMKSIDNYYYTRNLDFLSEPLHNKTIERIQSIMKDEAKIEYWLEKGRDKLKQLNISEAFILQISNFEKRFLDQKYHKMNNLFLMFFISFICNTDIHDQRNIERSQCVSMVLMLDKLIKNILTPEIKERVLFNIQNLEDQFLDKVEINKMN